MNPFYQLMNTPMKQLDSEKIIQTLITKYTSKTLKNRSKWQGLPNLNFQTEFNSVGYIFIPSVNFQFFMYKKIGTDGSTVEPWYLLYNPLHRQHYQSYYKNQ